MALTCKFAVSSTATSLLSDSSGTYFRVRDSGLDEARPRTPDLRHRVGSLLLLRDCTNCSLSRRCGACWCSTTPTALTGRDGCGSGGASGPRTAATACPGSTGLPYDTDAHWSAKLDLFWNGYKLHVTEACHPQTDGDRLARPGFTHRLIAAVPIVRSLTSAVHRRGGGGARGSGLLAAGAEGLALLAQDEQGDDHDPGRYPEPPGNVVGEEHGFFSLAWWGVDWLRR
jgi:hypothetical protein